MNIYNYISDLHLSVGETKRTNCPSCNGYKTFTVTNNMGRLVLFVSPTLKCKSLM